MNAALLPAHFRELEAFLDWSLPTERERMAKRQHTPMADIAEFYAGMSSQLEEIITYLNRYPHDEMPADARRLCDMALAFVEICNVIEMYKNPALLKMMEPERFVPYE
ncbi:MAG TPA: hypothetical protein PJ986_02720 [Gammaproteobacteria bacterium]|nr:hypothetical protein [Gammaproteobacteria bacterium]